MYLQLKRIQDNAGSLMLEHFGLTLEKAFCHLRTTRSDVCTFQQGGIFSGASPTVEIASSCKLCLLDQKLIGL